jgi:hypothetical protein
VVVSEVAGRKVEGVRCPARVQMLGRDQDEATQAWPTFSGLEYISIWTIFLMRISWAQLGLAAEQMTSIPACGSLRLRFRPEPVVVRGGFLFF